MKWESAALETLKVKFGDEVFTASEACRVLVASRPYKKVTVYRILHDLSKEGLVMRLGRGIYRIQYGRSMKLNGSVDLPASLIVKGIPESLKKAEEALRNNAVEFMLTGISLFSHYLHQFPRRLIYLIYVIKGAGELAVTVLNEVGLRPLLNPTRKDINSALDLSVDRELVVIREFFDLAGNVDGHACLERALVDLYFETTRGRMPFPSVEDSARIFLDANRNEHINFSRLFFLASRRGIKEEIETISRFLEPQIPVKPFIRSKFVKDFLRSMEKAIQR